LDGQSDDRLGRSKRLRRFEHWREILRAIRPAKSDPNGDSDCNIATVPDAHCFPPYTDTVAAAADTHCDSNCDAHTDSYAYNHSNCYSYTYTYFDAGRTAHAHP